MRRVLVTAAGGTVGQEVVRALSETGTTVRAAGLSPERLRAVVGSDVERVKLDFFDARTYPAALEGCDGIFLVRPQAVSDVDKSLNAFVDAAVARGIEHIVFMSVMGASGNRLVPHFMVEEHVRRATSSFTLLRPGFFAQNLGNAYRRDVVEDGRLFVPAGRGRVAFVDVRDVADVAARVFREPAAHRGQAYTLTGPEAVSFDEAARILTTVLGRPIHYEPAPLVAYVRHLGARGLTPAQVAVQTLLHVGLRYGQGERIDPTTENLLGRPGRTLERYIHDHAHLWLAPV